MPDGWLTTHVLDTAAGCPAAGLEIELFRLESGRRASLIRATTNDDGRTDAPLLGPGALAAGIYELVFGAGPYLARRHGIDVAPPFLDEVPVRFGVADPDRHYHVPLLLSPYGYATYRGS